MKTKDIAPVYTQVKIAKETLYCNDLTDKLMNEIEELLHKIWENEHSISSVEEENRCCKIFIKKILNHIEFKNNEIIIDYKSLNTFFNDNINKTTIKEYMEIEIE